jgi:hypothetical protein
MQRAFVRGANKLLTAPLFVSNYDNRVSIEEIIEVLKIMNSRGVKVALLDNLNFFLEVANANDERAVLDYTVHELVMFTKRTTLHVILICHPRKTDGGRVISEFDIKGSSLSVQESSNVILFNRPTKEDLDRNKTNNHRELCFKKSRRRGNYVNCPIWYCFKNGRYEEDEDV